MFCLCGGGRGPGECMLTNGGAVVIGRGTKFTSLQKGDKLRPGRAADGYRVHSIVSDEELRLDVADMGELIDMMVLQSGHDPAEVKGKSKKRKTLSLDEQWERLSAAQTALHPYWESVIDKWYTRAHFGIEKNGRSNLFRQTIWEQVRCIHVHVPINDNSLLVHILCTLDSWRYSRSRSMYREILHADGRVHSNGFALAVIIV